MARASVAAVAGLALLGAAVSLRAAVVDRQAEGRAHTELSREVMTSPGPDVLRLLALQHPHAVADMVWLQLVQLLGEHEASQPAMADRIERWSIIASDLDPLYFGVQYYSAVVLIAYAGRVEASDRLARRGEVNLPLRWEFPFLLGYNAYFVHGKPNVAAQHWIRSARLPGVPRYVPSLIARSKFQSGHQEEAMALLERMMEVFPPGPHREDAEIRLKLLRSEVTVLTAYDRACKAVQEAEGRIPTPVELYSSGAVRYPPKDLLGKEVYFDDDCRARTELIKVREDEAAQRIGAKKKSGDAGAEVRVDGG